jgi:hypothetical protein
MQTTRGVSASYVMSLNTRFTSTLDTNNVTSLSEFHVRKLLRILPLEGRNMLLILALAGEMLRLEHVLYLRSTLPRPPELQGLSPNPTINYIHIRSLVLIMCTDLPGRSSS